MDCTLELIRICLKEDCDSGGSVVCTDCDDDSPIVKPVDSFR